MSNLKLGSPGVTVLSESSGAITQTFPGPNHTFTVKAVNQPITDSQTGTAPDVSNSTSDQLAIYNGVTKLWGISEAGYVVNPTRPAFHVYTSGSNYSSPTSDTKYDPNNVKYNIGNFYDTTNDRATAPMPGLYHFQWFVNTYNSSGSRIYIRFKVNGSFSYIPVVGYIGNASDTSYGITMQLKLEAGDYVEASWYVTGGGTASNGETWSGFLGRFVG